MTPAAWILASLILLWSSPIGEVVLPVTDAPSLMAPKPNTVPKKSPKNGKGTLAHKELNIKTKEKINQKQFLDLFKEQAFELDLRKCLQNGLKQTSGELSMAAELQPNGQLKNIRTVDDLALPACAEMIIAKMRFQAIAATLETSEHTVFWALGW